MYYPLHTNRNRKGQIMESKEQIQEKINNIQKIYFMDELSYLPHEIYSAVMVELSKGLVKYYKKLQKI